MEITHYRRKGFKFLTCCGIISGHTASYQGRITCLNCVRSKADLRSWLRYNIRHKQRYQEAKDRVYLQNNRGRTMTFKGTIVKASERNGCSSVCLQDVFQGKWYAADHIWVQAMPAEFVRMAKMAVNAGKTMTFKARAYTYAHANGSIGYGLIYEGGGRIEHRRSENDCHRQVVQTYHRHRQNDIGVLHRDERLVQKHIMEVKHAHKGTM